MFKSRKLRKLVLLSLCFAAVVAISVGATLAYLTDSEGVVNTFTVGQVHIDLNETDTDDKNGTKGNEYHLVPGQTYTKDPTVTVLAKSEPAYVRMFVTVQDYSDLKAICIKHNKGLIPMNNTTFVQLDTFVGEYDGDIWECVNVTSDANADTATYEFRYHKTTDKSEDDVALDPLFTTITAPGWFTNDDLKALSKGWSYSNGTVVAEENDAPFMITVTAQAIQAAGFTATGTEGEAGYKSAADNAWAAFDAQYNN